MIHDQSSPPNGYELSGPAQLLSTENRVLAGSAAANCYPAYSSHGSAFLAILRIAITVQAGSDRLSDT